jgi:hypothetical protein
MRVDSVLNGNLPLQENMPGHGDIEENQCKTPVMYRKSLARKLKGKHQFNGAHYP